MELTRRGFLKATAVGSTIALGFDVARAKAEMREFKISRTTETRSVCPYCAVGCGVIIHTLGDKSKNAKASVVHVEGDPDQPVSRGTLCPKGITLKDTRDKCFVAKNAKGEVVNRNPGIAMIGGCTDTNEFNYLQWKVITALGVPYRDTQARV